MLEADVLVVGTGPGGASAALQAARAGLRVIALERRRAIGVPVQCAEYIPLALASRARAPGVQVQRIGAMNTILPSGAVVRSALEGLMIDRARFDRSIAGAAQVAGAQVWTDSRLIALNLEARRAWVRRAGAEHELPFRVLIAADGPHSSTAALLGLPPLPVVWTRQYTVPLRAEMTTTDVWIADDYPGGYAWLFPKGRVANLGLGAERRLAPDLKRPLEALRGTLIGRGIIGAEVLARTGGAIPVGGMRARLVHGQALFVGDAAGLTHPISGAGIAAAVLSGEAAGRVAAEYLHGGAGTLADYEEDMRDQFEHPLARAVMRRAELDRVWHTSRASRDDVMRRGWIAFDEYYAAARSA